MDSLATLLVLLTAHSAVLTGCALLASRALRSPALRSQLLRTAILSAFLTAPAQLVFGWGTPVEAFSGVGRLVPVEPAGAASTVAAPADRSAPTVQAPAVSGTPPSVTLRNVLLAAWAAAAASLLVAGARRRRRFLAGLEEVPFDDRHARVLAGLPDRVRVTRSARLGAPVAISGRQICVPEDLWSELDEPARAATLAHEMAHLERRDPLFRRVSAMAGALLFHQPLLALARRREAAEAELDCDAIAARHTEDPAAMAQALAAVAARALRRKSSVPVPAMASGDSDLVSRVRALTIAPTRPASIAERRGLAVASILALSALACTAPRLGADPEPVARDAVVVRVHGDSSAAIFAPGEKDPRARLELSTREGIEGIVPALKRIKADPDVGLRTSPLPGGSGPGAEVLELVDSPLVIELPWDARWREVQRVMAQAAQPAALFWNVSVRVTGSERSYALPIPKDVPFTDGRTAVNKLKLLIKAADAGTEFMYTLRLQSSEQSSWVEPPVEIADDFFVGKRDEPITETTGPLTDPRDLLPAFRSAAAREGLLHLELDPRRGTTVGQITDLLDAIEAEGIALDMISTTGSFEQ